MALKSASLGVLLEANRCLSTIKRSLDCPWLARLVRELDNVGLIRRWSDFEKVFKILHDEYANCINSIPNGKSQMMQFAKELHLTLPISHLRLPESVVLPDGSAALVHSWTCQEPSICFNPDCFFCIQLRSLFSSSSSPETHPFDSIGRMELEFHPLENLSSCDPTFSGIIYVRRFASSTTRSSPPADGGFLDFSIELILLRMAIDFCKQLQFASVLFSYSRLPASARPSIVELGFSLIDLTDPLFYAPSRYFWLWENQRPSIRSTTLDGREC